MDELSTSQTRPYSDLRTTARSAAAYALRVADGSTSDVAPVTSTAAIPEGGGAIFPKAGVVITQPEPGVFVGFDSTCPHQGCTVRAIAAGTINCFCHGSRFRIADGSVAGGPAEQPLRRRPLVIRDGNIILG